jgi:creatinine amidohydrolase
MLHIAPSLVRPLSEAGEGKERRFRIAAFREGWAWVPRQWTQVSTDTGIGDPGAASREKGERYTSAVVERLSRFLVDLAAADPNDLYETSPTAHSGPYRRFLRGQVADES